MLCISLHWAFASCCLSVISLFYWSFSAGSQGRSKRSNSMILTWGIYLLCVDPHLWAHIYLLRQINPPVFFFQGFFFPVHSLCELLAHLMITGKNSIADGREEEFSLLCISKARDSRGRWHSQDRDKRFEKKHPKSKHINLIGVFSTERLLGLEG